MRNMNDLLHGSAVFLLYVIPAAGTMFAGRFFLNIPDELFRKLLHFILLGAYIPVLYGFQSWKTAVVFCFGVIALFYPLLALAGRIPAFSSFVNERKAGEFKHSLVLALSTMAVSIWICWGMLADKLLVLACVYAWGVGDAFAALVGKRFGRHKISLAFADRRKSLEGSAAMFLTSALSVAVVLRLRGGLSPAGILAVSLAAAAAATFTELCTRGGYDTVTCPAAAMAVILPLIHLLGG